MMSLIFAAILLSKAATDPWNRPTHARVVIEPPKSTQDLYSEKTRFRLWWDNTGETAQIEIRGVIRWKVLEKEAHNGWISPPLAKDTVFRLKLENSQRASAPLVAPRFYSPTDIAQLGNPNTILDNTILDIDSGDELWAAGYSGGLIQYNQETINIWTRWDGLPDDRVLSVAVEDDVTWVGTANGVAQIYDGVVQRIWDEELADPYVQTLEVHQGTAYVGTYRGLDTIINNQVTSVLPKWSVFSVLSDGNRTAVGYEGITYINTKGQISSQDWPGNVNALAQIQDQLWMGTQNNGLVTSNPSGTKTILDEEVNDILDTGDKIWLAGNDAIWSINRKEPNVVSTEINDTGTIYAIEKWNNQMWVATGNGLQQIIENELSASPISEVSSDIEVSDWLVMETGFITAGTDQPMPPHIDASSTTNGSNPTIKLLEYQNTRITLSKDTLILFNNGNSTTIQLDGQGIDLTQWLNKIWVATSKGLYSIKDDQSLQSELLKDDIKEISSDGQNLWIRQSKTISQITPTQVQEFDVPAKVTSVAPSGLAVCVGTEDGLFRLWKGREEKWEDPLGSQDHNVYINSVLGDSKGGCWMAAEDGSIGRVDKDGYHQWWNLPQPDPPTITQLLADGEHVWVLTTEGVWMIW